MRTKSGVAQASLSSNGRARKRRRPAKVKPVDALQELTWQTCGALTVAENMRIIALEDEATADAIEEQSRIICRAVARLPLPATLGEACKLVADLHAAAAREGTAVAAATRLAHRMLLIERVCLRHWPARSTEEIAARLAWLHLEVENNHDPDLLRDVLQITIADVKRIGSQL